ncbi:MAG TPA: homoserine kinase [Thermoanaerobaculia bacterium]|nr:homoserine kinase [Thermoanaerobaculia bacterium]
MSRLRDGGLRTVCAYGPAGVGNMAAGFDVLGAALAPLDGGLWGDLVEAREAEEPTLSCTGPFAHLLPDLPADNLAWRAREAFARRLGKPLPAVALRLHKGLPVASGLGSSSATVVATIRALDALLDHPLPEQELLAAAGEAEAHASGEPHLDNVAPALLGGLRLVDPRGEARLLPFPDELRFVLLVPELTLSTRVARAALPGHVPLRLAVSHAQNLASLVHALHAGDRELLRACLRDLLAEPYRADLVRGFAAVQAAGRAAGAWGCSLSGAGPAVFAVAEQGAAAAIGEAMRQAWAAAGVAAAVRLCGLDRQGARIVADGCG